MKDRKHEPLDGKGLTMMGPIERRLLAVETKVLGLRNDVHSVAAGRHDLEYRVEEMAQEVRELKEYFLAMVDLLDQAGIVRQKDLKQMVRARRIPPSAVATPAKMPAPDRLEQLVKVVAGQ